MSRQLANERERRRERAAGREGRKAPGGFGVWGHEMLLLLLLVAPTTTTTTATHHPT